MPVKDGDGFELFDFDPATGRSVWRYFDGEKTVFRTDYPVDSLVKQNAESRAHFAGQRHGDWSRVASVPLNVAYDSGLVEAIDQNDEKFVSRYLNDSDNRAWRTKEGSV
jgi:hypothetical protein